jgi:predicted ATPase
MMGRAPTIDRIRIKRFGCIQDVELKLSPLHAFIGPNDSGKSTILRAARTGMQLLADKFSGGFSEDQAGTKCLPFHPGIHENTEIEILFINEFSYHTKISKDKVINEALWRNGKLKIEKGDLWNSVPSIRDRFETYAYLTKDSLKNAGLPEEFGPNHSAWRTPQYEDKFRTLINGLSSRKPVIGLKKPRMVRLDPDSLRLPGGLIPSSQAIELDEKGTGLASIYDALMIKNVDFFISIREQFKRLFPTVSTIGLKNVADKDYDVSKILELELKNGKRISAQFMSEGMLYYLAFAALKYLEPASILLVEEPENGLHPSRIKEIMTILREISETTQILIATHSPLVINELKNDEVSVVWREDDDGTKAMPIAETAHFAERSKVYALGELWLSYANGIDEEPLRKGGAE